MTDDPLADAYNAGLAHEKAGRLDQAAEAYREALALDPADPGGVAIRLAAMGRGPAPDKAPPAYVATLFDQHAEVFDSILVDQLGYAVPMMTRERLQALSLGPFDRMLDLGCGTGLAGLALEDMCSHLTGVDIAEGMVEVASDSDVYGDLYVADAVNFLDAAAEENESWDLIVATDVFPYLGDAALMMDGLAGRVAAGGIIAFSTETLPDIESWRVTPFHRYAHASAYITAQAGRVGLAVLDITDITVRTENGAPIAGHLYVMRKS